MWSRLGGKMFRKNLQKLNVLASVKLLEENLLLGFRRVNSITIYPEFHNGVAI